MIGQRIRTARQTARLSQTALAQRVGISVYRLRQYERDQRVPDEHTLLALADALGVELDDLLRIPTIGEIRLLFACCIDEHDLSQWYPCTLNE